ncbi:terminal uridylyltransferase Tailor-like [Wyeomyia smithii]|uniref:terminal uridylyltransferase Tailor-like n=1 Tax=Wyeomyia smithii TaxID=174621 RepID=UPI002467D9BF|nr:terminal uridylyltransferase Tailor-like [Wyeomyia smithii]
MNELTLLNLEISCLTKTLTAQSKKCTTIKIKTVDLLNKLLDTVSVFLTNHSIEPNIDKRDADDDLLLDQYFLLPKAAVCKRCSHMLKFDKSHLLKHSNKHSVHKKSGQINHFEGGKNGLITELKTDKIKKIGDEQLINVSVSKKRKSKKKKVLESNNNPQTKADIFLKSLTGTISVSSKAELTTNTRKQSTEITSLEEAVSGLQLDAKQEPEKNYNKNKSLEEATTAKSTVTIGISQIVPSSAISNKRTETKELNQNIVQTKSAASSAANDAKNVLPKRKPRKRGHIENASCTDEGCFPICTTDLTKKMQKFLQKKPVDHLIGKKRHCLQVAELSAHTKIAQSLEKQFKAIFPDVKAYPFGSRITNLATETSDLDIFLDLEGCYDGINCSKLRQERYVRIVEQILRKSGEWIHFEAIVSARTPILRTWNISEKIDCDISFANGLSHRNSMLIQYMFELQPICYDMAIYIKEWAKYVNINGLNSYTLIMLILFFFQQFKLLPSVYELQKDSKNPTYIQTWRADFQRKTLDDLGIHVVPESSLDTYLTGFFSFYGAQFPIETHVVCPYLGFAVRKIDFEPDNLQVPMQMRALVEYYDELHDELSSYNLAHKKPIVVQDPFDLIHNVAKSLDKSDASKFRHFCLQTAIQIDENFSNINKNKEALKTN